MIEENPIIEEIRRTREQMLAKHDGELDSLVNELQQLSTNRVGTGRELPRSAADVSRIEPARSKKVG